MSTNVVVTGAGSGMGQSAAKLLAARGVNVLAVDINAAGIDETAAQCEDLPGELRKHVADISDPKAVREYVTLPVALWGGLDGLYNNAAIGGPVALLADSEWEPFEHVLRTNVGAVWHGMRHAIPLMLERGGGAIVNTASLAGSRGVETLSPYVTSKHAVIGLTRTAALEYGKRGIRINALAPGSTNTPMMPQLAETLADTVQEGVEILHAGVPIGRMGEPDELASVAVWMLLDAPPHMSGSVVSVDGGQGAV